MNPVIRRPSAWRVTLLVGLLTATVLLASLLAYDAHRASKSERVTAERVLHDYATVAMWELLSAARKKLDAALSDAFGGVTAVVAGSPFEIAPPLGVFRTAASRALPCPGGVDAKRAYVLVDLRSGSFTAYPPGASEAPALAVAAQRFVREDAKLESPLGTSFGFSSDSGRVAAFGVRYTRLGAPLAVYGLSTCTAALGAPFFAELLRAHPLLPSAGASVQNEKLFAVAIIGDTGDTAFVTRAASASVFAEAPLEAWGGARVRVGIRSDATAMLVRPPAVSRVPWLLTLLVLAAGLTVVAVWQIRREHELAELRADFTSSVSHELRTPLAQILLFGETLALNRARSADERRLAADTIVREARRLMHIVDTLLSFSRRGSSSSALRPIDLEPLLRDIVAGFAPLARAAGAGVELVVEDGVMVVADGDALRQIVLNLLDNAIKYGPSGQTVRVRVHADGDRVRLSVDDEGPGIAPRDRERVWRPYVRLREPTGSRGRAAGGSGIGLAVVRELSESLGARVWVEDAPRGGSRFVLDLARAPVMPAGPPPAGNMHSETDGTHNPGDAADIVGTHPPSRRGSPA